MEDTLEDEGAHCAFLSVFYVLILVLVEDTLEVLVQQHILPMLLDVLILVLVEDTLEVKRVKC